MDKDTIIRVEGLGKRYTLGAQSNERYTTLRDAVTSSARGLLRRQPRIKDQGAPSTDFWALNDVSFEVKRGEVVGIIGRNGAGKSTLLKILSRITEPTKGSISLKGRVASLLEVGTGFHPELTGRENIFLNGAILGMHRAEIRAKFDEIVAFAEVEKFLDTPVKRYSSGMYVRLAFAVAAHLEPEILVVDEVLAVGDVEFQKKCLGKMESVAKGGGRTVLFVSHNMGAVNTLCQRVIYLVSGAVKEVGPTPQVISNYYKALQSREQVDLKTLRLSGFGKEVWFTDIRLDTHHPDDPNGVLFGQDLAYSLEVSAAVPMRDLSIGSSIFDHKGDCVGSLVTEQTFSIEPGQRLKLRLAIKQLSLAPGQYHAGCSLGQGGRTSMRQDFDIVIGQPSFEILPVSATEDSLVSSWHQNWGSLVLRDTSLSIV